MDGKHILLFLGYLQFAVHDMFGIVRKIRFRVESGLEETQ